MARSRAPSTRWTARGSGFLFFMPKIGLTVSYEDLPSDEADLQRLHKYMAVVDAAGGTIEPLFLNDWEGRADKVVHEFDGLLLAGGADLPTSWYGQRPLPGAGLDLVSERRPEFERAVVSDFVARKMPVLGICYGCQFLNVLLGGTLVQDIGLQWPNPIEHRDGAIHTVGLLEDSLLSQIVGLNEFEVPSFHHQAIQTPAPGGKVVGWAPDGVLEAIEWPGGSFLMGVQWHPERAPQSLATQRLIAAFLQACRP